jgi:hypothetical protein
MRIAIALLVVALAVLVWLFNGEKEKNRDQQAQIQKLTASLADKSKREELELQEKCGLQAERLFREFGYKLDALAQLQSHYNSKLNRCFMTVLSGR